MSENLKLISGNFSQKKYKNNSEALNQRDDMHFIKNIVSLAGNLYDEHIVIKFPKSVLLSDELLDIYARNCAQLSQLGANVVVVHDFVSAELINEFHNSLSSNEIIAQSLSIGSMSDTTEALLSGFVTKKITSAFNKVGINALPISGKNAGLLEAKSKRQYGSKRRMHEVSQATHTRQETKNDSTFDASLFLEPYAINVELLMLFNEISVIPIVSPLCFADVDSLATGLLNSDYVAAIIALGIDAKYLIYLENNMQNLFGDLSYSIIDEKHYTPDQLRPYLASHAMPNNIISAGLRATNESMTTVVYCESDTDDPILRAIFGSTKTYRFSLYDNK